LRRLALPPRIPRAPHVRACSALRVPRAPKVV
jgi:hypothetical protein